MSFLFLRFFDLTARTRHVRVRIVRAADTSATSINSTRVHSVTFQITEMFLQFPFCVFATSLALVTEYTIIIVNVYILLIASKLKKLQS